MASARDLVLDLLDVVGLEVGDYHEEYALPVIDRNGKLFHVKLEGWGPECVPGKGKQAARAASEKLARQWRRSWQAAGSLTVDSSDVWAMTWAVDGPLKRSEDSEDVAEARRRGLVL